MFEPEVDGQDHDRMETDEESDDSDSGTETPTSAGAAEVPPVDPEAMDITPDTLEADGHQVPSDQVDTGLITFVF